MRAIYLDYNATTPIYPTALALYQRLALAHWGNPSSLYRHGQAAKAELNRARARMAERFHCDPSELVATSGGSESINWALNGLYRAHRNERTHVITSPTEHHATLHALRALAAEGAEITYLDVDRFGRLDLDAIERAIRPRTLALSLMMVNNETGLIHPVEEIGKIAKAHGIFFHCDAVCAVGKLPMDLSTLGADLVSFSAHKFYGPKGVGGLYLKKGLNLATLIAGGAQEGGRRAGTENVPGIAAMAEALDLVQADLADEQHRLGALRARLLGALQQALPTLRLNTCHQSVSNTLNISIPGLDAEMAVIALDREGIAVSTGSACTSGATDPSHVLMAMGQSKSDAKSALRFSLGRDSTAADIERLVAVLPGIVERCLL